MSLQPKPFPALPEDTARVAKAAFKRKGNVYLTIGDQLGSLFDAVDFALLYAADGKPAASPNLLALVTVFQFMENLPDRDAADAVRARIDWKYALHLSLTDIGFDASILCEFRERLAQHEAAQQMLEQVLQRLQELDLLRKGGKQRTDATAVLAATELLNRVQLVAETMRLALEDLAAYRPAWLRSIALPHWYERYSLVLTGFRLPRTKEKQEALALEIAADGFHLLDALVHPEAPSQAASLPAVMILAQVWQQQFERHDGGPQWRARQSKPPAAQVITSPHDPDVRYTSHNTKSWTGYQIHWTETCDADRPHLITHVATPPATTADADLLPQIHADLAALDLLPSEHFVDAGYTSADNIVDSRNDYGVALIGPVSPGANWQAGLADGITLDQFRIDWAGQFATCPNGQRSAHWWSTTHTDGNTTVSIHFAKAVCDACPLRQRCTKSTLAGRSLRLGPNYALLQAAREQQQTADFRLKYALRVGIEGTISAAVRQHGARRARYIGQAKTHTQAVLTAIAINLRRTALWLMGLRPGTTRPASLACLAPTQLAA
jgi:transposase